MKVSVMVSDPAHPVLPWVSAWLGEREAKGDTARLAHTLDDLTGGDVLFLVSCNVMVGPRIREKYGATLVLHASNLPDGRGWSPYIWAVLGGADRLHVCLLEASEPVDSGDVWLRDHFDLEGHELLPEIHAQLFATEVALMNRAVEEWESIRPVRQQPGSHGQSGAPLRKRGPADSELDPDQTIARQFDLMRTADTERFPSFFHFRGHRYKVTVEKWPHDADADDSDQ